eukprot:438031_1
MASMDCDSNIECQCTTRMIDVIKCYELIERDAINEEYMDKVNISALLDDYIHILIKHDNGHLHYMANLLMADERSMKCDSKNCKKILRYYRSRENDIELKLNNIDIDSPSSLYRDIMDQIHCNVFHFYDMGMRVKKNAQNSDIRQQLKEQLQVLNVDDNTTNRYNKYNIDIKYKENTFTDGLFAEMLCKKISYKVIQHLQKQLENEEYDSDALKSDIRCDYIQSNIVKIVSLQQNHYSALKRYLHLSLLYRVSFSTGYTFYYWNHYRKSITHHRFFANQNDHSGFKENELYVVAKYRNIQTEILNNCEHKLSFSQFNISMKKATEFIKTKKAKTLTSECPAGLFYGIEDDTAISISHLLSIILYTDWSDLCTAFNSTFRRKLSYEPISSVKKRNSEFANWAKLLREIVQLFGQQGYQGIIGDKLDEEWNTKHHRVKGPFFCGMSHAMVFPEFNIKLCGPTSTSKQYEVADRFASDDGVIIQLDNYGYLNSNQLRTFCCSWVSNYGMEDEWLFVGGHRTIKIASVTVVSYKNENFEQYFDALFYFDCIVNGNMFENDFEIEKPDLKYQIFKNLIEHKTKSDQNEYHQYINRTFECFLNEK